MPQPRWTVTFPVRFHAAPLLRVDDLRLNVENPILAWRELRNILEEVDQVKATMSAAHGDADLQPRLA
jgi:hypothetical protein